MVPKVIIISMEMPIRALQDATERGFDIMEYDWNNGYVYLRREVCAWQR